jgi:uncharacterized phage protein (TIGR02218 family)
MGIQELHTHLASGLTSVARAWAVTRKDGVQLGFTDHDRDLAFDGITFRADTGMSARALQQTTGLSVDNTEALGALTDSAIKEEDIAAGRYDGAEVVSWLVNWRDVSERRILFRGSIGEMRRGSGAFQAELRGLSEALNQPMGRVYQRACTSVLGDGGCGFDSNAVGFYYLGPLVEISERRVFRLGALTDYPEGWFQWGRLTINTGDAQGLSSMIKRDHVVDGERRIEIWEPLRADPQAGDMIRIEAGCDKRFETCKAKFGNVLNFRGFPDLPDEDWISLSPTSSKNKTGGSRR